MAPPYEPEFSDPLPETVSVPAEIVVAPLNVLLAESVSEP